MSHGKLELYRAQIALLRKEQRRVVEDIVNVLHDAKQDGFDFGEVMDDPGPTPDQPEFPLSSGEYDL